MNKLTIKEVEIYKERFLEEFSLIKRKGFVKYFLIVADIVKWAKDNDIPVGPARGSAGGSAIAYLTDIVSINPIKHGLSFSRFLNESRTQMPDIDEDFCQKKRPLIKERLKNLYGNGHVAGIPTFLTMKDKMVVRDVARAFDVPLVDVNKFSSIIGDSLEEAFDTPEGKEFKNKYPEVAKNSLKLNGTLKGLSTHAAGLIISDEDLMESSCTHLMHGKIEDTVCFYKGDAEYVGLLKLDALGLINLTIIDQCLKLIKENHGKTIDLNNLNLEDKNIYDSIKNGNTTAIFQLSTKTMAPFIKKVEANCFNDIVAAIALVRPGTRDVGLDELYVRRKHGEPWEKQHEVYEEITSKTYGICVYQEQVTEIINKIAGLSKTVCEDVRSIIAKKRNPELFKKYEEMFLDGCEKMGYFTREEGAKFWAELQAHSRYSFNLSHSCSYALLGYQTAWLRHYYPLEFYCANLTYAPKDKKPDLIKEITKLGLKISTPKVGKSHAAEWIVKDQTIFIPFSEIHGVGESLAQAASQLNASNSQNTQGFFNISGKQKKSKKLKNILEEINAYNDLPPKSITFSDFDADLIKPWEEKYPRLLNIKNEFNLSKNFDELYSCENISAPLVEQIEKPKNYLRGLGVCKTCTISENCKSPVKPDFGKYNVMIVGESSHWMDSKSGTPLGSDEGSKFLFPFLKRFGLTRGMFYVTNIVKCVTKKPTKEEIINCNDWLTKEIEYVKPKLVLAFGNTGLKLFAGKDNGIKRMNGTTEWNETFDCWVCYSVRPMTAMFDDGGKEEFKTGIRNFVKKVRKLGLKEMEY